MKYYIPLNLPSLANMRAHWRRIAKLKQDQKLATSLCMRNAITRGATLPPLPLIITITRIGKRKMDDDNLAAACKYVRDQIAAIIGTDDGSPLYTWQYQQRIGKYGVDVEITPR